jgi:NAD(P)-dependent dehydrogenase (short-subunit alcohol dehydrogenase family)
MRSLARRAARLYGDRLFHLLIVTGALALTGYTISVLGLRNLFNPTVWWQSIAVWFAVAVIGHDFILFPLYALAERLLSTLRPRRQPGASTRAAPPIPVTNYLRLPTLATGLVLLLFLPGIIQQGAPTYHAATGLTQAPYLTRWLLLTAAFYLTSTLCYTLRTIRHQRAAAADQRPSPHDNVATPAEGHPAAQPEPKDASASMSPNKSVLITGANTGLGKELARQLALREDFDTIYLACRNPAKADVAQRDLTTVTGRSIFELVIMDMSRLDSVRAAIPSINRPLDAVVMNAGGTGGPNPMALTADGVTEIFAANVLGHVVLLDGLLTQGSLREVAVLTGSEAARGVPKLRIPRPAFANRSADEFATVIDGSFFGDRRPSQMLAYAQVKYLGALWMATLAGQHTDLRFITMSPGNTAGTEALRDLPQAVRILAQRVLMPYVAPAFGLAHRLEDGGRRLVSAVTDPSLRSGVFYGSAANTITGPVIDQAEIMPELGDPAVQNHAVEAIYRFIT